MAEGDSSQMVGDAADWLAWLANPRAPIPLNLRSTKPGTPYGGRTFGGSTFGGATYGDPSAAKAIANQPSGVPDASSIGQYLTNPGAAAPDVSVSAPGLPSISAPPSLGVSGRMPPQAPRATAPGPTGPQPVVAPPPADESQNTSSFLSWMAKTMGLGGDAAAAPPTAADAVVQDAVAGRSRGMPQVYPKGAPSLSAPMNTAMGGGLGPAPTSAPRPAPVPQTAPPSAPGTGVPPGPGVPPPSVPEDASQNIAMGTGPGTARTLSHEEAAGLGGAAASVGAQVANDPSITSQIIKQLSTQGLANDPQSAWLALAQAGFSMAASRNPSVLGAMGEGAVAGLQGYQQSRAQRAQQLYTAGELQNRVDTSKQQGDYQKASLAQEAAKTKGDQDIARAKLPAELKELEGRADYYSSMGGYRDAQAAGTIPSRKGPGTGGGSSSSTGAGSLNLIRQSIHDQYLKDNPTASDGDAWEYATTAAAGRQDAARNAYIGRYVTLAGYSLDGLNKPPAAILQEASDSYDQAAGGGGAAAPAAAPAAAAAAPAAPVGKTPPGTADGMLGGGGTLKAKGGLWYPVQ